eukprot:4634513-Pleurochrysis_carterae.AAC.1
MRCNAFDLRTAVATIFRSVGACAAASRAAGLDASGAAAVCGVLSVADAASRGALGAWRALECLETAPQQISALIIHEELLQKVKPKHPQVMDVRATSSPAAYVLSASRNCESSPEAEAAVR